MSTHTLKWDAAEKAHFVVQTNDCVKLIRITSKVVRADVLFVLDVNQINIGENSVQSKLDRFHLLHYKQMNFISELFPKQKQTSKQISEKKKPT